MSPNAKQLTKITSVDPFDEFCKFYEESDARKAMKKACEILCYSSKVTAPPVQLENFLSYCNAELEEKDIPTNGRLEIGDNCYRILVQKKLRYETKRFKIAHELGHIIITNALESYPDHLKNLMLPSSWNKVEKLCNYAAAQILVPDEDFVESVRKFGLTTEGIEKIRCRYQVSYEVIFQKFISIFSPSAVILWKSKGTGLDIIAPRIVRYPYTSIPSIPIEKGSIGTPRLRSIVKTAISQGRAWANSIECQIDGKKHPIIAYAIPLQKKNPFTDVRIMKTPKREYEESTSNYYDVIMFYLPTDLIYKSDALQEALTVG